MLSRPLTLGQSEHRGQGKPGMAPPSDASVGREPAPPPLPLAEDLNAALPLAEAWTQTDSSPPQMAPPSSPPQMAPPPDSSPPQMAPPSSPPQMAPPSSPPQMAPPPSPPPGPCLLCASLPRLISSLLALHQREMKRLLEGAMASVERRLSALEEAEPAGGPSQSEKRRRRREEKETRRKRRKNGQSEESVASESQSEDSAGSGSQSGESAVAEGQSEKSVCAVVRRNGFSSYDPLGAAGAWRFSDSAPRSYRRGDARAVLSWLLTSPGHAPVRLPWRLSVVTVETSVGATLSGVGPAPERPLQDHSAPPYIAVDHSYVRLSAPSLVISARRQQRHRANHSARRRPLPLPPVPTNGLAASLTTAQSATGSDLPGNKRDVKRVSQIRIRRASPKETNLTPLGLPRVKRLKKKEFSLEEIYTNKNYKSPSANSSSLETIFEEPREKDGALLLIGQQRRRRVLHFPDFTQPRKRKRPAPSGVGLVAMVPRKRVAARRGCRDDDCDSDVMLLQRLSALHDFLQRQGLDHDS